MTENNIIWKPSNIHFKISQLLCSMKHALPPKKRPISKSIYQIFSAHSKNKKSKGTMVKEEHFGFFSEKVDFLFLQVGKK